MRLRRGIGTCAVGLLALGAAFQDGCSSTAKTEAVALDSGAEDVSSGSGSGGSSGSSGSSGGMGSSGGSSSGAGSSGSGSSSGSLDSGEDALDSTPDARLDAPADHPDGGIPLCFGSPVVYGSPSAPYSLTEADFNGDGTPDFAVAEEGWVTILLGHGDGTFSVGQTISGGLAADVAALATADFNGDGILDIAASNPQTKYGSSYTVVVLLGKGDGTFQTAGSYDPGGYYPGPIVASDFNGDGDIDLATVDGHGGSSFDILLGNGDGTFRKSATVGTTSPQVSSLLTGDFNGDHKVDEVGVNGGVDLLLGKGNGTFQPVAQFSTGSSFAQGAAADFNGDGLTDVAVTNGSNGVSVLLGRSDGTLSAPSAFTVATGTAGYVAAGDLNDDGNLDLAVAGGQTISILLGDGKGGFAAPYSVTVAAGCSSSVVIADFNGDGRLDVACGTSAADAGTSGNGVAVVLHCP